VNRIDQRFAELAEHGKAGFIPYVVAGDPTLARTEGIVLELERVGADIIELGVPFSDPVADGPANQEGALRALKHHVTLHDVIGLVKEIRTKSQVPLLLFTYFNPVWAYGIEAFATDCADAGVDGVLCVDLPPDEAGDYCANLNGAGVHTVFLATPTSTEERLKKIADASSGFIYCVSRTGVTGERDSLLDTVKGNVALIKQHTDKPVAVGFGISRPEHASEVAAYADGVVVGSAIVRVIGEHGDSDDLIPKVGAFVKSLVDAAKQSGVKAAS